MRINQLREKITLPIFDIPIHKITILIVIILSGILILWGGISGWMTTYTAVNYLHPEIYEDAFVYLSALPSGYQIERIERYRKIGSSEQLIIDIQYKDTPSFDEIMNTLRRNPALQHKIVKIDPKDPQPNISFNDNVSFKDTVSTGYFSLEPNGIIQVRVYRWFHINLFQPVWGGSGK